MPGPIPTLTRSVARNGTAQLALGAGVYSLTGRSSRYEGNRGLCQAAPELQIAISSASGGLMPSARHVTVVCPER
jgi:hypothetical protein